MPGSSEPLLQVADLGVDYKTRRGRTTVLDGVSFEIAAGETLGLVGESGSGKTTIGRAILGLAPVSRGAITFEGSSIVGLSARRRRELARKVQVVFQDPYSSLNPSMRIEEILAEPLLVARVPKARGRVNELLSQVGLPKDARSRYPREFSGGQRQRIALARALALSPSLIVCDEPTSALDMTTQARVLTLLADIRARTGVALLFISHDLGVVREVSDRVAVLRAGVIVEIGDAQQVTRQPAHPYSRRLQLATPVPDPVLQRERRERRKAAAVVENQMRELREETS